MQYVISASPPLDTSHQAGFRCCFVHILISATVSTFGAIFNSPRLPLLRPESRPGPVLRSKTSSVMPGQLRAAKLSLAPRNGRRSTFQEASTCSVKVLVLIDVGHLAQTYSDQKGANVGAPGRCQTQPSLSSSPVAASTVFVDGLRLSVLRVLSQLSLSCPPDSCVEWAARFFDSRHSGVGKTPLELKARLRSRQAAQGTRGFTHLSQASFQKFGDACLAVASGVQGDPLARDRQAGLRRWSHGRKKQQQPQTGNAQNSAAGRRISSPSSKQSTAHIVAGNGADGPRHMYDGHDMSTHEVIVRSLLEVLQEFGEASESECEVDTPLDSTNHDSPRLLLMLHTAFPKTEQEVECFALRGNFTTEARMVATKPPDVRATALMQALNAGLAKAVLRGRSRGVSFHWQDAFPLGDDASDRTNSSFYPTRFVQPRTSLDRCLSAAGDFDVLRWNLEAESAMFLPPSVAHRGRFSRGLDKQRSGFSAEGSRSTHEPTVAVALSGQGAIDVQLMAIRLGGPLESTQQASGEVIVGSGSVCKSKITPWRLMGTLPLSEVWPGALAGQRWGATVLLRAMCDDGAMMWREMLGRFLAEGLVAAFTLPRRLFEISGSRNGDEVREDGRACVALTVALVMPISGECAVGWSLADEEVAAGVHEQFPGTAPAAETTMKFTARPSLPSTSEGVSPTISEVERTLRMRQAEVGQALQESAVARRRRRHTKALPTERMRGMSSASATAAAAGVSARMAGLLGRSGSLSPRESVSLCFTGEDMRGDLDSENSYTSGSPRSVCVLETAMGMGDEDERASSTGSSYGPRRALQQALEDASSRSSLLSRDADGFSTPGSKEGSRSSGFSIDRRPGPEVLLPPRSGGLRAGGLFPSAKDDEGGAADPAAPIRGGVSQLPLSFMAEPSLACLPAAPLPTEVVTLGERCALYNKVAAAALPAPAPAPDTSTSRDPRQRARSNLPKRSTQGVRKDKARRLFIAAIRAVEQKEHEAARTKASPMKSASVPQRSGTLKTGERGEGFEFSEDIITGTQRSGPARSDEVEETCVPEERARAPFAASGLEDCVSNGVSGLRRQYLEIVEGGQRSPVEFVVRTVPEAIRDLAHKACIDDDGKSGGAPSDGGGDRHSRASALVMAAIVSGLTASPEELGAKHRANKKVKIAAAVAAGQSTVTTEVRDSVATPAIQKVRDFQLQALLMCQLNALAMDLPDIPEALAVFAALATSRAASADGEDHSSHRGAKDKKGKGKGKGKGKRKRKGGGDGGKDDDSAPIRPCDPLPEARRSRLESFLQPISTMLDACTVTKAVPAAGDGDDGGTKAQGGGTANGFSIRAYDGTLADFMGLGLVEHFASRLPRTLGALFDDFERHPPEALTAALAAASCSAPSGGHAAVGIVEDGGRVEERAGKTKESAGRPGVDAEVSAAAAAVSSENTMVASAASDLASAGVSSRVTPSAGILLSDRTSMSHNHFKMSGVLNGFREVKLKSRATSGGLRPGVAEAPKAGVKPILRTGSVRGGRGTCVEQDGAWRKSSRVEAGGGSRGRSARDSKPTGSLKALPPRAPTATARHLEVRYSPRLARKRPSGGSGIECGDADADTFKKSDSDPSSSLPPSTETATSQLCKRRKFPGKSPNPGKDGISGGGGDGDFGGMAIAPRTCSGVLVSETPRKRPADAMAAMRARRREGGDGRSAGGRGLHGKLGVATGSPAAAATRSEGSHWPKAEGAGYSPAAKPRALAASPAEDSRATRRQRVMNSPSSARDDPDAIARVREVMPSPPSWRAASASGRLFVEESPTGAGVPAAGADDRTGSKSAWALAESGGSGSGIVRQLMTETASPLPQRRRAVVPDTPVC